MCYNNTYSILSSISNSYYNYQFDEIKIIIKNLNCHKLLLNSLIINNNNNNNNDNNNNNNNNNNYNSILKSKNISNIIKSNVYVSLTTIYSRISSVHQSIRTILNGDVIPTKIYLFLSEEPFLIDKGLLLLFLLLL